MSEKFLPTESYKGVRDFYPEDMAIERYIFDTWSKTAESFGFARYDASILESSELYKAKGAENEELVNEQTYTFTDRGEREVTLRPEMTPTVARMVAGKSRELSFPLRWYSIPNLFRYERPQRGRLREHWQLNCDIFGADHYTADVEIIALASQLLIDFGATPEMFEIRINDRKEMHELFNEFGILDIEKQNQIIRLNDRYHKITPTEYQNELHKIISAEAAEKVIALMNSQGEGYESPIINGLSALGINNTKIDRSLARGFNYYTGTIFEIFDKHPDGSSRSMLGGGRYDDLTKMFTNDQISGIGFGMGDVTMRDFLETHNLLPASVSTTSPILMILPLEPEQNLEGQKIASQLRQKGIRVAVDIGTKKIGKKISQAVEQGVQYTLVVGSDELSSGTFTLKNLALGTTESGTIDTLLTHLIAHP
jgi:histidyl-tRNA synthetase